MALLVAIFCNDRLALTLTPESCHLRELELCTVGAASMFQNPNGIPLSQKEIKRQCEYLSESTDCYQDYTNLCMTKIQSGIFQMFGRDIKLLQEDFCDDKSDLRKNYTKFGPCLREIQQKYQRVCISDLQAGFEGIHKVNTTSRLPTTCCNVNRFKECIMTKIEDECGEEVVDFILGLIRRVASNAFTNLCRNYDTDFVGCSDILPPIGSKPHVGRNTSAISRIVSSYANAKA